MPCPCVKTGSKENASCSYSIDGSTELGDQWWSRPWAHTQVHSVCMGALATVFSPELRKYRGLRSRTSYVQVYSRLHYKLFLVFLFLFLFPFFIPFPWLLCEGGKKNDSSCSCLVEVGWVNGIVILDVFRECLLAGLETAWEYERGAWLTLLLHN